MGDILKNIFEKNYENFVVDVFFERNFSKNEKKFLEILFFNFDNDSFYMSFDITNLKKVLNYKTDTKLLEFFEKLTNKKLYYTISDKDNVLYSGFFPIINSCIKSDEKISISVPEELKMSFRENTFFSYFNFDKYIFMEEVSSLKLYDHIITLSLKDSMSVSISELRDILGLRDNYTRFFDFEKYILKKIIKDINIFTDLKIEYKKLLSSNTLIQFYFTKNENRLHNTCYNNAKKIMKIIDNKVVNAKAITNLISSYIMKKGYNYVYENSMTAYSSKDTENFDSQLKKALLYDHADFEKKQKDIFILFFEKYETYKNSLMLYNDLYKYLNKILYISPLLEELYSFDIVTAIRNLQDKEIFEYKNSDFKIFIQYSENKKSLVQLFFKEKLINSAI